jgi:peptide deformylase
MLSLIYAPNTIFKQIAKPVAKIDDQVRRNIDEMFEVMAKEKGIGMGANMVGLLDRIIVLDWPEGNIKLSMINPEITWLSKETQQFEEASLSYPSISAIITRPNKIKLSYLDLDNKKHEMEAEGFLSTLIQHEIDYLNGITFLDHLSKLKREVLLKKMQKFKMLNQEN